MPLYRAPKLTETGRVSATTCAKVYNTRLGHKTKREARVKLEQWNLSCSIRGAAVWDAYVVVGLLRDHTERQATLVVPDKIDQRYRFTAAMKERNARYQLYGLGQTRHRCDKCMRVYDLREKGGGLGTSFLTSNCVARLT